MKDTVSHSKKNVEFPKHTTMLEFHTTAIQMRRNAFNE